jgi:hypothetical protein
MYPGESDTTKPRSRVPRPLPATADDRRQVYVCKCGGHPQRKGRDEHHGRHCGGTGHDGHDDAQADRDRGNDEIARRAARDRLDRRLRAPPEQRFDARELAGSIVVIAVAASVDDEQQGCRVQAARLCQPVEGEVFSRLLRRGRAAIELKKVRLNVLTPRAIVPFG